MAVYDEGAATLAPPAPRRPSDRPVQPVPAKNALPANEPWNMPPCRLGQLIMWRQDRDDAVAAAPAIVTKVGQDSLALTVFVDGNAVGVPRDGVRHQSDPRWTRNNGEAGVWWSPETESETLAAFGVLGKVVGEQNRDMVRLTRIIDDLAVKLERAMHRLDQIEASLTDPSSPNPVTLPAAEPPMAKVADDIPVPPVKPKGETGAMLK